MDFGCVLWLRKLNDSETAFYEFINGPYYKSASLSNEVCPK